MRQRYAIPTIYQNFTAMIHIQFNTKIKTWYPLPVVHILCVTLIVLVSISPLWWDLSYSLMVSSSSSSAYTNMNKMRYPSESTITYLRLLLLYWYPLLFLAFFGQKLFSPLSTLLTLLHHLSCSASHLMSISTLLLRTIACSAVLAMFFSDRVHQVICPIS